LNYWRRAASSGSGSPVFSRDKYIGFASYPDIGRALEALRDGRADAIVYNMPILSYRAWQNPSMWALDVAQ